MTGRARDLRESVRGGFWAVPSVCVLGAVVLALALVRLDRARSAEVAYAFGAGPDGAREVLSAITTAMITFTGLVFSITIVVLQLASSQFSPRVLRTFLRDRQTQASLGVFVATFVYAVMVLRTVDSADGERFVPAVATTVAVVLLLASVGVFVLYIHHVATSIQVSSIIEAISTETRASVDRRFPAGAACPLEQAPPAGLTVTAIVPARRSGVVVRVDEQELVRLAAQAGVVLHSAVRLGQFVPEGAPLLHVAGAAEDLDVRRVLAAVRQARDRSPEQDVSFGLRQLVDIAARALSPGINDPTTAVESLDALHDLLRRLATRPLHSGVHTDGGGAVRLVLPPEALADFLSLALEEISQYGRDSVQVRARLTSLLVDLEEAAAPEHRAALQQAQRRWPAPATS